MNDNNYKNACNNYANTHIIKKVPGVEVNLKYLEDNQSVVYGDGKTYYIKLTRINQP